MHSPLLQCPRWSGRNPARTVRAAVKASGKKFPAVTTVGPCARRATLVKSTSTPSGRVSQNLTQSANLVRLAEKTSMPVPFVKALPTQGALAAAYASQGNMQQQHAVRHRTLVANDASLVRRTNSRRRPAQLTTTLIVRPAQLATQGSSFCANAKQAVILSALLVQRLKNVRTVNSWMECATQPKPQVPSALHVHHAL